jgi:hypothetical protein
MHFGLVAARTGWRRFLPALSELSANFIARGSVQLLDVCDLNPTDDGVVVVGGEHESCSYLVDTSKILSTDFDLLGHLSRQLGCVVAGCFGEAASGSYYWMLAEYGRVRRVYGNCRATMRAPFEIGPPLATEAAAPLEDGDGLMRALEHAGFKYSAWTAQGSKTAYLYAGKRLPAKEKGPLRSAFDAHCRRNPRVISRLLKDGSVVYDILGEPQVRPPRLRGALGMLPPH